MASQSPAGQGGDVGRMRDESRLTEQLVAPSAFHLLGRCGDLGECAGTGFPMMTFDMLWRTR